MQLQTQASARKLYSALESGDNLTLDELLHPDFVGETTAGLPLGLGGSYRGVQSMTRDFWWRIGAKYDLKAVPSSFSTTSTGTLLVEGFYEGRARGGHAFRAAFIHLFDFKDSRIVGLRQLTDSQAWAQALPAATAFNSPEIIAAEVPADEPADGYKYLLFEMAEGLATITLNRPEARNAVNGALAEELLMVAMRLAEDATVRAVHIRAHGPAFTVGGDIDVFASTAHAELPRLLQTMTAPYHHALTLLSRLRAPIICEVQGAAAGGGLGLIYIADIVLAGESAKFAAGFAALGLSGDGGNSWYLPKLVGVRRAASFYLEQKVLSAEEACEWGMITRVVDDSQLQEQALMLAQRLAGGPTVALGNIRELLHESWTASLPAHLAAESSNLARSAATEDAIEAIASFTKKQQPTYKGK